MSENTNERLDRYAEAITDAWRGNEWDGIAGAAIAVADAEQAELRAEVERLQKDRDTAQEHVAYHLRDYSLNGEATGDLAVDMAAYSGRLRIRAEAAEAERDRARSLAATLEAQNAQVAALASQIRSEGIACKCGHTLDEHNGLGCYARLSYTPLVTCECKLTDDRTHEELLLPLLFAILHPEEPA